jgi:hypothetical protein
MREAPTEAIFEQMRAAAILIWRGYDNTHGYVDEKVGYVNSLENIGDNAMVFYRMFDFINQGKMRSLLSDEALDYIDLNR